MKGSYAGNDLLVKTVHTVYGIRATYKPYGTFCTISYFYGRAYGTVHTTGYMALQIGRIDVEQSRSRSPSISYKCKFQVAAATPDLCNMNLNFLTRPRHLSRTID